MSMWCRTIGLRYIAQLLTKNPWRTVSSVAKARFTYSAAAKKKKKKKFKWVQLAVRHRLTYIKMFVLTSSLRKPMLTSWHFGAGGDILGQKHVVFFFTKKCEKLELYYKTVKIHQRVVMSRGSHRNVSQIM